MILPNIVLPSRVNARWDHSGIDSVEGCRNKKHFKNYPHTVEYVYNSRGFRDADWPDSLEELKNAIWCIGDSFTVGLGSPLEHTWPYLLQQQTGRRCINISMDGASNSWIFRNGVSIIKNINPKTIILHWSFIERREQPNKLIDQAWNDYYTAMWDPSWPMDVKLENFNTLPAGIQDELLTNPGWQCGLSDEQMRLPYINTTDDEDVNETIDFITAINQIAAASKVNIVHSFIPAFVKESCREKFCNKLPTMSIVPEFEIIDFARDGFHYDLITAKNFIVRIIPLLI
jgi:hypothetical protein